MGLFSRKPVESEEEIEPGRTKARSWWYSLYHRTYDIRAKTMAVEAHEHNPNARFLDCGAGGGGYTMRIVDWIGTKDAWGLEVDPDLVAECKSRGLNMVHGDLGEPWDIPSDSIDIAHASGIIDHIFDTDKFFEEVRRTLKPGGYIMILNNNLAAYHHIFTLLCGRQPAVSHISERALVGTLRLDGEHWGLLGPQRLKRSFTTYGMQCLLEYYGFRIEMVKGVGFYPLPPQLSRIPNAIDKYHAAYFIIKARKPKRFE